MADKVQNSVILKSKYYFFYIRMSKQITGFLTIPVTAWLYLTTDKVNYTAPQQPGSNHVDKSVNRYAAHAHSPAIAVRLTCHSDCGCLQYY